MNKYQFIVVSKDGTEASVTVGAATITDAWHGVVKLHGETARSITFYRQR